MLFKNEIKDKYLNKNSLATKLSLSYGILLIIILALALTTGVVGVFVYLRLGIKDVEELLEILIYTSAIAFGIGSLLIITISPILSKKILEPLAKITLAEQEISIEKLDKRINYDGNDLELKSLSDSFDKMIERLELSFNKQNQFISDVSHELKTPIAVISGYANLLDRWGKDDKETLNKSIQAIKNETKNMNDLVSKLLYIAKVDAGKISPNKVLINISDLINEVIEESILLETNRNIFSTNNEKCFIKADENNVKELIRIFIDNAIKYTNENGNIDIYSKRENGRVYINIKDDGVGISKQDQENIFDRFYRVDKSRNKETGGVGLGLAIATSIASLNDAQIKIESELNKGSIFSIIFKEEMEKKWTIIIFVFAY